ncbi:MAG: ATP-binding protein [Gammaproteobacteria bacterium]|nr:ATP-binding protein [Gammaproteobacteria bacterium]
MNLRRQLLLVSLLLLSLPWAGCQFVREMEGALQFGQEQSLLATTRAIATVLGDKPQLLYPNAQRWREGEDVSQQLYATAATAPIIIDGYADGWAGPAHGSFGPVSYRAQSRGGRLYLLFTVRDSEVVYHDPRLVDRASGDRLLLRTANGDDYVIVTAAPGPVQARLARNGKLVQWESRIRGQWQDSLQGFNIELEMPLQLLGGRLGFSLINASTDKSEQVYGNMQAAAKLPPPWLIYPPDNLQALITPFASGDLKLQVLDSHHWVISRAGQLDNGNAADTDTPWLIRALYRAILNGTRLPTAPPAPMVGQQVGLEISAAMSGQSAANWYAPAAETSQKLLTAASPIFNAEEIVGVVMAQQSSEQYLSLTDRAFNRLLLISLAAMAVSALGLLGYASWLSWRIRRLSAATREAIGEDGRIRVDFGASRSGDELGELSRRYAELLLRLREYTDYLRSLSRKLSHELRTPIAVISSSLDNLEQDSSDQAIYLQRAREGLGRLSSILTSMSEASRLEESVHSNHLEEMDLARLCREMLAAYQSVYPEHTLELDCAVNECRLAAVPDLIVQALDKLVDNATSFTPVGERITLRLQPLGERITLSVENQGPLLPAAMQTQLFDSMVSVREKGNQVHLGLGLHIVRLIMDFHGGRVWAENLPDASGVRFTLEFGGTA